MSGSFVFAFTRRPVREEEPMREATPKEVKPASRSARPKPPPIPADAKPSPPVPRRMKNPVLAMTLSIIPGMGQFYNGDFTKGLLILATCWLIFPWIVGIFDAYFKARMINRRAASLVNL
jgi:TM2 domain-containing membrane protein YozV